MKIYKREEYLKKIRPFYKSDVIKVITGIRRCGKSYLLKSIIEELQDNGVNKNNIIYIELDKKGYKNVKTPEQLEKIIDDKLKGISGFKYLFIDEIENVKNYEPLIEAYRLEGNISIFMTGSNSYLLSGELSTKLTGRYVEFEVFTLTFYEYLQMKAYLKKNINADKYIEFDEYIRIGGFPGALEFEDYSSKLQYVMNVIKQIYEKDIHANNKIRDKELFDLVQKYVINNYGAIISVSNIQEYLLNECNKKVDSRTIKNYIDLLKKAKIIYPCDLFDIKSKRALKGDKKYYLADTSIYFAFNTDNRINYGPALENIFHNYLLSKNYNVSVGRIGKLEVDFIAREEFTKYFYIQISMTIGEKETEDREYRPFYNIKDMYPRYLFTLDRLMQERDGVNHCNLLDFIMNNKNL